MSVTIRLLLNGVPVPAELDDDALDELRAALSVPPPEPEPEWLNIAQTAEYLKCTPGHVYDLRSSGRLPKDSDGSRALNRLSDLRAYMADNETFLRQRDGRR